MLNYFSNNTALSILVFLVTYWYNF